MGWFNWVYTAKPVCIYCKEYTKQEEDEGDRLLEVCGRRYTWIDHLFLLKTLMIGLNIKKKVK